LIAVNRLRIQTLVLAVTCLAVVTAGCAGDYVTGDRAAVTLVVDRLSAASGATGDSTTTLQSDVLTNGGIFSDNATVTIRAIMKNPDSLTGPTQINAVTITRYRVTYRRANSGNQAGVDVPHPFDSATTFTVPAGGAATQSFELIRHTAKLESPLAALRNGFVIISTIADIEFYGHDQAGNAVSATASIGVQFGDFADPQ
jgi:hypothetical protein